MTENQIVINEGGLLTNQETYLPLENRIYDFSRNKMTPFLTV